MLIGYENFGGMPDSQFDTRLAPYDYTYVKIKNCILDEVIADNNITIPYTTDKKSWDFNTVFLATFENSFECGNIQQNDQLIDSLRFKRRAKGTLEWIFIEEVPYNKEMPEYFVRDRLAYSLKEYDYAMFPVSQGIEGEPVISSIICTFEGLWLVNREDGVKLFYDLDYGSISHITNDREIELLERKYPMFYSTSLDYEKGSNSATVVGDKTGHDGINVDYLGDREEIDRVMSILKNHRPKILKDGNGSQRIVMTKDIAEKSMKNMHGGVCTISFNWFQVGDATSLEDLIDFEFLPDIL